MLAVTREAGSKGTRSSSSYYDIPKAIFYLLEGPDCALLQNHTSKARLLIGLILTTPGGT